MLDVRPVFQILGWVVCWIGITLLVPTATDLADDNVDWQAFLLAAGIALFAGGLLVAGTWRESGVRLDLRQSFIVVILGWVFVAGFGAIPFLGIGISFTDAVFESMSGLTTTGSTVLTGLDGLPRGVLLWRAMLQWVGGIGIIAIAALILPLLRVGGMQLFKIESSGSDEDKAAADSRLLILLFSIYTGLTLLCALVFSLLGMEPFDAITHAMTTLSTGGYSTHDASFGYFPDWRLHWAGTFFMICGAIPFFLYVRTTMGNWRVLVSDAQVRGFLGFLAVSTALMTLWLHAEKDIGIFEALTLVSFNITSVVTTTGFATADYTAWGPGAVGMFLMLMFVGGCSGSTSGAIKIYRYQVLWIFVRAHVTRLFSPNRVIALSYNGQRLDSDVPTSILAFLAVFIATIGIVTVLLALCGLDIVTAYSASLTAITNVGPGMGEIIGPAGNFQPLPDIAKWILTSAMLAGRLEVLVLLVLFDRDFWID
ncbi:MAG: TrkH family potassium uptake protein [Minwuia sp.]|nr:TrkH family potassium uptake protein [Minwuia sp.]